jgi:hypothetical protein
MARMDLRGTPTTAVEIPRFGGLNTAVSFAEIDITQSPDLLNVLPGKIGSLRRRPGSVPLTTTALGTAIKVLCNLRIGSNNSILATSGTTLYKYNSVTKAWDAQTMTNALTSATIDYAQFKDASSAEVLVIADGGSLKRYNGTTVANITPAANDASPLPANAMTTIQTAHPPIGCIIHNNRVVIWDGSDTLWHSKAGFFDYFIATDFQRYVRENDYIVTCVSYQGALLVLMRRHIGALFGDGYSATPTDGDWSQDFLDTSDGCINGSTVQLVTYPDGRQEIFYLGDRGVNAINRIDTLSLDTSARYSTVNVTDGKIDWNGLGVSKADWALAKAVFYEGRYWLIYPDGAVWKGLVFNTQDGEWYPVDNLTVNSFYQDETYLYFTGTDGHLKVFDSTLYVDYTNAAQTTSAVINAYWYSKLINPKKTSFDHFWDTMMVEARQFDRTASVDLEVNTYRGQYVLAGAIKTAFLIVGETKIGEAVIANRNFTDFVNLPDLIRTFLTGQYAQMKLSNNRDEPFEIFSIKYNVRVMD